MPRLAVSSSATGFGVQGSGFRAKVGVPDSSRAASVNTACSCMYVSLDRVSTVQTRHLDSVHACTASPLGPVCVRVCA